MNKIYKYPLEITDKQSVSMIANAEVLCVQMQTGTPCIWAMVDNDQTEKENRTFFTYGTGYDIPNDAEILYVGTYQHMNGSLVFHVFEQM